MSPAKKPTITAVVTKVPTEILDLFDTRGKLRTDFTDLEIKRLTPEQQLRWAAVAACSRDEQDSNKELADANAAVVSETKNEILAARKATTLRSGFEEEEINPADMAAMCSNDVSKAAAARQRVSDIEMRNRMGRLKASEQARMREIRAVAASQSRAVPDPATVQKLNEEAQKRAAIEAKAVAVVAEAAETLASARSRLALARDAQKQARQALGVAVAEWQKQFTPPTELSLARQYQADSQRQAMAVANGTATIPARAEPASKLDAALANRPSAAKRLAASRA